MKKTFRTATFATMLVALAMAGSAQAGIISISSTVGGGPPAGVITDNLDLIPLGLTGGTGSSGIIVTFGADGQAVQGSLSGYYAAPYISGSNGSAFGNLNGVDTTPYLTTGIESVTIRMPAAENYFGLLWGSVDSYNTLSFYNNSTLVGSVTGASVLALPNGDQGVNGTVYVNLGFDTAFNKVVATSSSYAFEFDNIAFNDPPTPVPEPASLLLLGTGVLGFAGRAWRKRRG